MIAYLQGSLIHKSPAAAIVDVNGVGYQVNIPLSTYYGLPDLKSRVSFKIHTYMREDGIRLYGFSTEEEQKTFEKLIGISKVGPKLALTILSGMSVRDFMSAVSDQDIARLSAIPGVGPKTAERLALEMRDKLKEVSSSSSAPDEFAGKNGAMEDALSALLNLGYKRGQAEKAIKTVTAASQGEADLGHVIKECLKIL
ncbi:MAG: Holliday junction branch migration protein RuvA [Nitrospinales bacterium]